MKPIRKGVAFLAITATLALVTLLFIVLLPPPIAPPSKLVAAVISAEETETDDRIAALGVHGAQQANVIAHNQAVTAAASAAVGLLTLLSAIAAALYAKAAADQARRSADIARDALIASERAWLNIELQLDGPIEFTRDGGVDVPVSVKVSNIGKTPAINVHTNVDMTLGYNRAPNLLKDLAVRSRHINPQSSRLLLPGRSYDRKWGASPDPTESGPEWGEEGVLPMVVVCVTYQTLPDLSLHQTAESFMLGVRQDGARLPSSFHRAHPVSVGEIAVEGATGGFAD